MVQVCLPKKNYWSQMTPFSTVYTVFLCIFLDLDGLACGTGALVPEAQKPKTFQVATFYAQKLSGRSARNTTSLKSALLPLTTLLKNAL